jgi:hypothetical protein
MYSYLLFFHSIVRWLLLFSLFYAVYSGIRGWVGQAVFTARDNRIRHITATLAHVQLTIGYVLYFNSPLITYFRTHFHEAIRQFDFLFFGLIHIVLMTLSVVLITIGSSVSKRLDTDQRKFKVMTLWFSLALLIIFIAIPWPFSPLANRPYLRSF